MAARENLFPNVYVGSKGSTMCAKGTQDDQSATEAPAEQLCANSPRGEKGMSPLDLDSRHFILADLIFVKAVLQSYFQALLALPIDARKEMIEFFTSDVIWAAPPPENGQKRGYVVKGYYRWKMKYVVLDGPILKYYTSVRIHSHARNLLH
jgi:hypothetical protein